MLGRGKLSYEPTAETLRGWAEADAEMKDILERDGLARVRPVDQRRRRRLHGAPVGIVPHR